MNKIVTTEKKKYQVIVLIVLMLILSTLIFVQKGNYRKILSKSAPNSLAIGKKAKVSGPLSIDIAVPVEFDFKLRTEILDFRTRAVNRFPQLLATGYKPASSVFGQISDKASWWGIQGEYFHDCGSQSIEGESEESRFILNPFLLVAADFLGLSIWKSGDLVWDKKKITEAHLKQANFPFCCQPDSLKWWPEKSSAEVRYNVSGYLKEVNKWVVKPLGVEHAFFDLIAYNARDFDFNYIFLPLDDSENISQEKAQGVAVFNNQFIHLGGSSGYPGGSNNMSPFIAGISDFKIDKLPAKAVVFLWHEKPASIKTAPDMTFVIKFY